MIDFTDIETEKIMSVYQPELFKYGSRKQKLFAENLSANYILVTGDNRGRLPMWIKRILKSNGLWFKKIGCTTYRSNTFALYPKVWAP
jgi:hypothetical protein